MTGENEPFKIEQSLCELFRRDDNPHSYLYTYVAEIDGDVAGTMVLYSGTIAPQLDKNLSTWLVKKAPRFQKLTLNHFPMNYILTRFVSIRNFVEKELVHNYSLLLKTLPWKQTFQNYP